MGSDRRARLREWVVVVGGFVVAGALAGWLWHAWWAPAPLGVVVDGAVYFPPDHEFAGTGLYMVVAASAGLLLGALFALVFERDEVTTLAAILTGAVAAGLVMAWVGHALGPEAAAEVARRTANFEEIPGDLHAGPLPAYAAFPAGSLVGTLAVWVTFGGRPTGTRQRR